MSHLNPANTNRDKIEQNQYINSTHIPYHMNPVNENRIQLGNNTNIQSKVVSTLFSRDNDKSKNSGIIRRDEILEIHKVIPKIGSVEHSALSPYERSIKPNMIPNTSINLNRHILPVTPDSNNNSPNDINVINNKINYNNNPSNVQIGTLKIANNTQQISKTIIDNDESGIFVCHYCDAKFKIRGYLTRHIKKHALQKAYHCPYYNPNLPSEARCHTTGGFSRRDTYKTHLKARHFTYPEGVRPNERGKSCGLCTQCNENFGSTDIWIKEHIEMGQCRAICKEFLESLSDVSNKKKTNNKLKMIKTSTGHSRFISTVESVVEPKVLLNKDALEAMVIVVKDTNRSDVLSKYGDDKLILNSDNFAGYKKPKRKYRPRKPKVPVIENSNSIIRSPTDALSSSASTPTNCNNNNQNVNDSRYIDVISRSNYSTPSMGSVGSPYNHPLNPSIVKPIGSVPLDVEQQSIYVESESESHSTFAQEEKSIAINETLKRQFDPNKINEMQLRETQQYLNFYNDAFGVDL